MNDQRNATDVKYALFFKKATFFPSCLSFKYNREIEWTIFKIDVNLCISFLPKGYFVPSLVRGFSGTVVQMKVK
jgi:hypothetical protein